MIIAETQRLILREFQLKDAADFFALNNDPDVIKYAGDKAFKNIEEAEEFLKNYRPYKKYDYGRWAVIIKESNEFAGFCGLKYVKELEETDIGFRLSRKYWNKGYATEAAAKCLDLGFNNFGLKIIVGRAMKENKASIRVLEKLGMSFWKEFGFEEHPGLCYKIEREQQALFL